MIRIADRLATVGGQDAADYLRRFLLIYRHLATSVEAVSAEAGQGMQMGMPPGFGPAPNVAELLDKTDRELGSLD